MRNRISELTLTIEAGYEMTVDELDHLARQLRNEIEQQPDIQSVERVERESAKAMGTGLEIGELIVRLAPIAVPALITIVKAWLDRQYDGSTETKLKLSVKSKNFTIDLKHSTSRQEAANQAEALRAKMESG